MPAAPIPSVVVAISMALLGLGGWLWWVRSGLPGGRGVLISSVLVGTVFSLALWLLWLLVAFAVIGHAFLRSPTHRRAGAGVLRSRPCRWRWGCS
ncbi:MAG: hypothetical protein U0360_03680 [Dehalococcoidia bacterium]